MKNKDPLTTQFLIQTERERRRRKEKKIQLLNSISIEELREIAKAEEIANTLLCSKSFQDFVCNAWSQIDPDPFIYEWFIGFVCAAFQETFDNGLKRLNINIPPGMSKSMIGSVMYPVWLWVKNASLGILTLSYAHDNVIRDAVKSRALIESEWFQSNWGALFKFSPDQNEKRFYKNDKFGFRQAFTILSKSTTGKRGHVMVIDDALNALDAFSKAYTEKVILAINQAIMSRLNNPKESIVINLGQRLSKNDPSELFLKHKWPSLILPMEFDPSRKCVLPFGEDIRTKKDEILTSRYDEKSLSELKAHLGPYGVAGQLQQLPVALEGGFIKLDSIQYYKELPNVKKWSWSWDMAVKTNQHNDFSVGLLWAECTDGYYLVYGFRQKVEYPVLRQHVQTLYNKYNASEILIEDKSSGEPLIQELRRSTSLPIISVVPGRDMPSTKEQRVIMCSPLFEAKKIFVPSRDNATWVADILEEWVTFPASRHDDSVDAMTQYLCRQLSFNKRVFDVCVIR